MNANINPLLLLLSQDNPLSQYRIHDNISTATLETFTLSLQRCNLHCKHYLHS